MNRRGFLGSILALGVAPAIVRADSLMRVVPREMVMLTAGWDLGWSGRPSFTPYSHVQSVEILIFPVAHTEAEKRIIGDWIASRDDQVIAATRPTVWYRTP